MTDHNRNESGKLARGAKWVIRQLLLELESRNTEITLRDAAPQGYSIFYDLAAGEEALVEEFAQKLGIRKNGDRLEVQHGID